MKKTIKTLMTATMALAVVFTSCKKDEAEVRVISVALNKTTSNLVVGDTDTLVATINPSNATNQNVTWSTNDTTTATVANGIVTATGVGTAIITVTTEDGNVKAACTVTVLAQTVYITDIDFEWETTSLEVGETYTLVALVEPADATENIAWTSSDNAVVTVANGVVTAVAVGKATITATSPSDGSITATNVFTVVAVPEVTMINQTTPNWGATLGTVEFVSDKTWEVGGLTWSDAVMASTCNDRTDFAGGNTTDGFNADCRHNKGTVYILGPDAMPWEPPIDSIPFEYGSLFSFAAAVSFRNSICPEGWRVPRAEDFAKLDEALGGAGEGRQVSETQLNKYLDNEIWGGELGGMSGGSGSLSEQTIVGRYWSISQTSDLFGVHLLFGNEDVGTFFDPLLEPIVNPSATVTKSSGLVVRCVR